MRGALQGIRVLDLSRVLAGPFCSMILGDLGAEVFKVERPDGGDDTREWGPPFAGGESAYYLCVNRNKKSVALDLKTEEGVAAARELAARCDVLIENFRAGGAETMGMGFEDVRKDNPGIVYCSISGYGQTGPYRDLGGYDFIIQAMCGLMSITGKPDGEPMKLGVATVDLTAGLYSAVAILAALRHRDRTGEGQRIDLSLMDAGISWLANVGSNYLVSGEVPGRYGNAHASIVPYQVFPARDGYVAVGIGNDKQWRRFCEIAAEPLLRNDLRFATNPDRVRNREILVPLLEEIFRRHDGAFWIERLWREGIPAGPINTVDKVFADPHAAARGMIVEMDHPSAGKIRLIGSPMKLSATPVEYRLPPPRLGEDTASVLGEKPPVDPGPVGPLPPAKGKPPGS